VHSQVLELPAAVSQIAVEGSGAGFAMVGKD
jgi:hypothetical protein